MRYPKYIKKNDTIGYVSPSFGCAVEPYRTAFERAKEKLLKKGYFSDVGPNCYKSDGIGRSTKPEDCGREFMEYYISGQNQALISCGGGELMCEMLDHVDFDELKRAEPKWFMGYSDNTNMTFLLATLCDTASVYGPCAASFGMEPWHPAIGDALAVLEGNMTTVQNYDKWEAESLKSEEDPFAPYNAKEAFSLKIFNGGEDKADFDGILIGGCLDCLKNLVGTKYDRVAAFSERYKEEGIVWFLEACDLNPMDIRRAMWQLDKSGWFKYVRGFIIGRPLCMREDRINGASLMGLSQYEAVLGITDKYKVPVLMDADIGHLPPMMPLIVGSRAYIRACGNKLSVEMRTCKGGQPCAKPSATKTFMRC